MIELCTGCGHALVFHGDRAVTACDGGYAGLSDRSWLSRQVREVREGDRRICPCPGWV